MKRFSSLLCLLLAVVPLQLQAQTAPGARTHDGFFLRFLVGGGPGALVVEDVEGSDLEFTSSSAGAFHFQIGGAVTENLILFGDIGGFALAEPDVEWGGNSMGSQDLDVATTGVGGGFTYYIMPANMFVSASILASMASMTFEGEDAESELGPSVFLSVGKEWWVGNRWGLGVAAFAEFGRMKDKEDTFGDQVDMSTRFFGIAFSATMN